MSAWFLLFPIAIHIAIYLAVNNVTTKLGKIFVKFFQKFCFCPLAPYFFEISKRIHYIVCYGGQFLNFELSNIKIR